MEENNHPGLGLIKFLLVVIAIGIGYLCFAQFQGTQSFDSTPKILIIDVLRDIVSEDSLSDSTQVSNALEDGGMIQIKIDNDWLEDTFGYGYAYYGASDSEGYHYTLGAVMNYVASQGWTFVQAPSSGLSTTYYFEK